MWMDGGWRMQDAGWMQDESADDSRFPNGFPFNVRHIP